MKSRLFEGAEEVGALVLLIEQLRGAKGFLDIAEKAAALGKPLIVVKFGRSEAARRGVLSHTGSLTVGSHA